MQNGGLRTRGITKTSTPEHPLITMVTVVFNGAATLEQTIQSVVNQTYDNVEYIIIDGASTDGTLDIVKKYEDKIDYWQSEPDSEIENFWLFAKGRFAKFNGCASDGFVLYFRKVFACNDVSSGDDTITGARICCL